MCICINIICMCSYIFICLFLLFQMLESSAFRGDKSFNVLAYIRTLEGVKLHDLDIVKEGVVQAGGLLKFWQVK